MEKNYLKLKSYAKINLYLNIGKLMHDGYHNIESIMQTINLHDTIYLKKNNNQGIFIKSNNPEVPVGSNSIIYKAAAELMKNKNKGVEIFIEKKIPIAAGLGGGSSNVATVLIGICKLFNIKEKLSTLLEIASKLGMDVPFFIVRGTVLAKGRGELIYPIEPAYPSIPVLLVNPGIKISTKWAYNLFDQLNCKNIGSKINIKQYLKNIKINNPNEIYNIIYNSFYSILAKEFPIIEQVKDKLEDSGSKAVTITGSGPTVYGIFERQEEIDKAYRDIKREYPFVQKTYTLQAKEIIM